MTDGYIRSAFLSLAKSMTTQSHALTTKVQAMMARSNRDVGHQVNPNASTMATRLRYFTTMNPPMFFGSKVDEDPQDFLDEVYKIFYAIGVSTS